MSKQQQSPHPAVIMIRIGSPYTLIWVTLLLMGTILWFGPLRDSIPSPSSVVSWRITDQSKHDTSQGESPPQHYTDESFKSLSSSHPTITQYPPHRRPHPTLDTKPPKPSNKSKPSHSSPSLTTSTPMLSANTSHDDGFAKQISASELLARPLSLNSGAIPKLLHQSWKSLDLPEKFAQWSATCRSKHPDWEWVLWTDEDNLRLVEMHFPWLEEAYRSLPGEIYRADLARNLYMYIFGGVYADLDTECLQSTEALLHDYHIAYGDDDDLDLEDEIVTQVGILGRMGDNPSFEHSIPNAWIASSPGHPFFLQPMENVRKFITEKQDLESKGKSKKFPLPEDLTGPVALREAIMQYEVNRVRHGNRLDETTADLVQLGPWADNWNTNHELILLPSEVIYPYSWGGDGESVRGVCWVLTDSYDPEECKRQLRVDEMGSISITYWSHSHSPTEENEANMKYVNHQESADEEKKSRVRRRRR